VPILFILVLAEYRMACGEPPVGEGKSVDHPATWPERFIARASLKKPPGSVPRSFIFVVALSSYRKA
jgi:hypothetical protein